MGPVSCTSSVTVVASGKARRAISTASAPTASTRSRPSRTTEVDRDLIGGFGVGDAGLGAAPQGADTGAGPDPRRSRGLDATPPRGSGIDDRRHANPQRNGSRERDRDLRRGAYDRQ